MTPEQGYASIKNHVLHTVAEEPPIEAFYLRPPEGGRIMSTLILFTPEGIVLMGDLTPERNGTVSAFGYGKGWFSSKLSGDYLCEKFLERRWISEIAEERLRDRKWNSEMYGEEQAEQMISIADELSDNHGVEWLSDELNEIGYDLSDGVPGIGYDSRERSWLIAIQQRFSECVNTATATAAA